MKKVIYCTKLIHLCARKVAAIPTGILFTLNKDTSVFKFHTLDENFKPALTNTKTLHLRNTYLFLCKKVGAKIMTVDLIFLSSFGEP